MPAFKRYRDVSLAVLFLTVPFFFLHASFKHPERLSMFDVVFLRLTAPLEWVSSRFVHGVGGLWNDYIQLVDTKQKNAQLSYDNARLHEQIRTLSHHQRENRELRGLLRLRQEIARKTVSAQVIAKPVSPFFRVTRLVLDQNTHALEPYMPVVAPEGIVGSVLHVVGSTLTVKLVVDATFGLDVENERTQARGFVRGTGDPTRYLCKVEMLDARDEIALGDLLVTSGSGKWFPQGIPVARVSRILRREIGHEQEVEATPTVDFARLENVLILVESAGSAEETRPGLSPPRAP